MKVPRVVCLVPFFVEVTRAEPNVSSSGAVAPASFTGSAPPSLMTKLLTALFQRRSLCIG